jgi:hypothetical protein
MKSAPMPFGTPVHKAGPTDCRKLVSWSNLLQLCKRKSVFLQYDSERQSISSAVKKLRRGTKVMTGTGRIHRVAFLAFAFLIFCATPGWSQGYERKVEMSWDFSTATTTLGWDPCCEPSSGFGVSNGALIFHATEQAWVLKNTVISVPGALRQLVEIVMSSDTTGDVNFSYFYGKSRESATWRQSGLPIPADGSFHHYYFPLDTSPATTTYELAIIPPAGGTIAVRSVALVTLLPSAGPLARIIHHCEKRRASSSV